MIWYLQILQKQMGKKASVNIKMVVLTRQDQSILAILHLLRVKKQWPQKRDRIKQFQDINGLNKLRQHQSHGVDHKPMLVTDLSKESRKKCVLCCNGIDARNTRYYCSICFVPLRTTVFCGVNSDIKNTCFKHWHRCTDLRRKMIGATNY